MSVEFNGLGGFRMNQNVFLVNRRPVVACATKNVRILVECQSFCCTEETAKAEQRSAKSDQTKTVTYQQANCERAL
jgi:hypothetical protein